MASNPASQQNLASRLAEVLRKMERDGDDLHALARKVGEERRDLMRWASGTTMPSHVLIALLDELPRHHADYLIGQTQYRLVSRDQTEEACAMEALAATSAFTADVVDRLADGVFCHQDKAAAKDMARATISRLQAFVGE